MDRKPQFWPRKKWLLAAIGAVASIHPAEARSVLGDLADSDDEEIAEAVDEAIEMPEPVPDEEDDEEVGSGRAFGC